MTDLALDITNIDLLLESSDLSIDSGLRMAVMVALFTDRRAADDDVLPGGVTDKRGCWMDTYIGAPFGSRLWMLAGAKETDETLLRAKEYAEESLRYLIDNGVAQSISVIASQKSPGVLGLQPLIVLADGSKFDDVFEMELN